MRGRRYRRLVTGGRPASARGAAGHWPGIVPRRKPAPHARRSDCFRIPGFSSRRVHAPRPIGGTSAPNLAVPRLSGLSRPRANSSAPRHAGPRTGRAGTSRSPDKSHCFQTYRAAHLADRARRPRSSRSGMESRRRNRAAARDTKSATRLRLSAERPGRIPAARSGMPRRRMPGPPPKAVAPAGRATRCAHEARAACRATTRT